MKAKIIKIKVNSYGRDGRFWWLFFKMDDGTSARTTIYPIYCGKRIRNFDRWLPVIRKHEEGEEVFLSGLRLWEGKRVGSQQVIDADSDFRMIEKEAFA